MDYVMRRRSTCRRRIRNVFVTVTVTVTSSSSSNVRTLLSDRVLMFDDVCVCVFNLLLFYYLLTYLLCHLKVTNTRCRREAASICPRPL